MLWKKRDKYEWRNRVHDAEVMRGIRYVRNSVHHDWSDAVQISEAGFAFPMTFPLAFFEWVWRPANELPWRSNKQHADSERFYQDDMQGKPVRHSLHALREVFRTLHVLLEPYTCKGDENASDHYPYPDGEDGIPPD